MLTILEGPDCAGKSTLAEQLRIRANLKAEIIHQGPYAGSVIPETLAKLACATEPHIIADRLHLGERVYGPVFRRRDKLGEARHRIMARILMSSHEPVQVVCLPPWNVVSSLWGVRQEDEMLDDMDQLRAVYNGFRDVVRHLPTVDHDWTVSNIWELGEILDEIRTPKNEGPGAGWWEVGNTLIVGDQTPGLPFCSESDRDLQLASSLGSIPERDLYWANALTPSGEPEDPSFIDRLEPSRIIALGTTAANWLTQNGIHHTFVVTGGPYAVDFSTLAEIINED